MSKFKVGDLITDKKALVQIIDVNETHYTIKYIGGYYHGKTTNTQKGWVDNLCVKYDLDNPLTKLVNIGVCRCSYCGRELHYGDPCVRYDDDIFCNKSCLVNYSEIGVVENEDKFNNSTADTERPLFDLTEKQIEEIKKERK